MLLGPGSADRVVSVSGSASACTDLTSGDVMTIAGTDLQSGEPVAWTWRVVDAVGIPRSLFQ